jgi:hypothetical protein
VEQAEWGYFKANYLQKKLVSETPTIQAKSRVKTGLPQQHVQEVISFQHPVIIEYLAQLLAQRLQEMIRRQAIVNIEQMGRLPHEVFARCDRQCRTSLFRIAQNIKRGVDHDQEKILESGRIRRIQGGFSFIPHRFLTDGFLTSLSQTGVLLYLFLVLASDRYGLSFYTYADRWENIFHHAPVPLSGLRWRQLTRRGTPQKRDAYYYHPN